MKNNNYSPIVLGDTDPYLKDNTGRRICRNGAYVPWYSPMQSTDV